MTAGAPASRAGLRGVAIFEAVKAVAVLGLGLGVLALLHQNVHDAAEHLIHTLHLNPYGRISGIFLRLSENVTDAKLWAAAAGALMYSTVRFVEAYGLWHGLSWAEWFALLSGCLYLPWEIYEVIDHPGAIKYAVLGANTGIVIFMGYVRWRERNAPPGL